MNVKAVNSFKDKTFRTMFMHEYGADSIFFYYCNCNTGQRKAL